MISFLFGLIVGILAGALAMWAYLVRDDDDDDEVGY